MVWCCEKLVVAFGHVIDYECEVLNNPLEHDGILCRDVAVVDDTAFSFPWYKSVPHGQDIGQADAVASLDPILDVWQSARATQQFVMQKSTLQSSQFFSRKVIKLGSV